MLFPLRRSLAAAFCATALAPLAFAGVELKQEADKVTVQIDGHLFTEYHFAGTPRPYLYPIIGPTGGAMTRHWPLEEDIATEEHDHPHHKGLEYPRATQPPRQYQLAFRMTIVRRSPNTYP
jgi:hypothetical protein